MSNTTIAREINNKMLFSSQILRQFIDRITGTSVDRVFDQYPEDVFFVGKLSPQSEKQASSFSSDVDINQVGIELILRKDELQQAKIRVLPTAALYYRGFPTVEEQMKKFQADSYGAACFAELLEKTPDQQSDVAMNYKKIPVEGISLDFYPGEIYQEDKRYGYKSLTKDRKSVV